MATVYPTNSVTMASGAGNYGNLTLGAGGSSTVTMSGAGGSGGTGSILMSSAVSNNWASTSAKTSMSGQLTLEGDNADLVMNGVSLKGILDSITDRLSILQPKPELLAKYDNLREAYEHYKTLEALLHQEDDNAK
jgi:hypothetical protein